MTGRAAPLSGAPPGSPEAGPLEQQLTSSYRALRARGRPVVGALLLTVLLTGATGCTQAADGSKGGSGADAAVSDGQGPLSSGGPSARVLALHRLSVPGGAQDVLSLTSDGWSSYSVCLTFRLPKPEMEKFLDGIGVPSSGMRSGFHVEDAAEPGWSARTGRTYLHGSSEGRRGQGPAPAYTVSLDVTDAGEPTVYLRSIVLAS